MSKRPSSLHCLESNGTRRARIGYKLFGRRIGMKVARPLCENKEIQMDGRPVYIPTHRNSTRRCAVVSRKQMSHVKCSEHIRMLSPLMLSCSQYQ